ncbi:MAG: hypothetical protein ACE5G1_07390 [bacterium]
MADNNQGLDSNQSVSSGLEQWQFNRIAERGFDDPLNSYAHTMAWFKDRLYVGTMRAVLCLLNAKMNIAMDVWPVRVVENVYDLDLRSHIWSFEPQEQKWRQVHIAPLNTGPDGQQVPREISYRGMTVFQGPEDPEPALYVTTWSPSKSIGPLILRSYDGEEFVPVSEPGLGDPTVSAFRSLIALNGRLYTAPTGRPGDKPNVPDNPVILESCGSVNGSWREVCRPGFGDRYNLTVFEMIPFNDYLYAGTLNAAEGYQVWKTRCEGTPPYRWTKVISQGAYRGAQNETAVSMFVFKDALYVGSGIQNGGYDRTHDVGPAAAELIRIHPDDSWDLIVGEPRMTPDGKKRPLSNFEPGFNNFFNGYFWRMAEYDGHLYLGTFNWSVFMPYLQPLRKTIKDKILRFYGLENLIKFFGGFDLFRSPDGVHWSPVSTTGFGNPYNYGARTMVGTPKGLFIGTGNPFGPEVAVKTPLGWQYMPNPRGGAEVWLGSNKKWSEAHTDLQLKYELEKQS